MDAAAPSLWRNRGFLRLWLAGIVSGAGGQITALALPLTAVVTLDATSAEMGLLRGAGILPELLLALLAGVWVDRARRQTILVGADLGRALLLGSIPLAVLFGGPTLPHLWLIAFAVGSLAVFSSLASISILPALVPKSQLVEANSRLTVTGSILTIAGPGAAGGLIALVGAPKAIAADAASYLLSALSLRGLDAREAPPSRDPGVSTWHEIVEGMRELVRTPLLRSLTLPVGLFARATAAPRIPMSGMQLAGAALGGLLGGVVGLRETLVLGAFGLAGGCLLLLFSPVREVRDI